MPYEPRLSPPSPTREDVDHKFVQLLDGSIDRDTADRWAMQWVAADDPDVEDEIVWWGLGVIAGVDSDLDGVYLHPDTQIAEWLDTYRAICAGAPIPDRIP